MRNDETNGGPTLFLLLAQYGGRTVIPLGTVCRDFFGHLSEEKLLKKCLRGQVGLPILRIEGSQKAQRGVHISDLARYIDERREAAIKERDALCGGD